MKVTVISDIKYFPSTVRAVEFLNDAFSRFEKNCRYSRKYAKIVKAFKNTQMTLDVIPKFDVTYGMAHFYGKPNNITGLWIGLNKKFNKYGDYLAYQIVSHELAHCLDFLARGDSVHDEEWSEIHKLMDGKGTTFIY